MTFHHPYLLAVTRIEELGRDFREETSVAFAWQQTLWFVIPIIAIALSLLIYRIAEHASQPLNRADALMSELYRAHGFSPAARRLCNHVADACDLTDPAVMMTSSKLFEQAVSKARQAAAFTPQQLATLDDVRRRLFA